MSTSASPAPSGPDAVQAAESQIGQTTSQAMAAAASAQAAASQTNSADTQTAATQVASGQAVATQAVVSAGQATAASIPSDTPIRQAVAQIAATTSAAMASRSAPGSPFASGKSPS